MDELISLKDEIIDDLRKLIKEQELEIKYLVNTKFYLESQVRILQKKNNNQIF
jgi:hypothetical protein